MQALLAGAPAVTENVPAGQSVHAEAAEAPVAAENVPAGQSVHAEAPAAAENVPAGQAVHTAAPVTDLYFPAAHLTHASWSGPVNPGLHTQLAGPTEPLADCEQPAPPQVAQNAQSG
jgi:hypothetical protein